MKVIRGLHNTPLDLKKTAITIGNFDGVHVGHAHLIHQLCLETRNKKLQSVVIIFEPQPNEFFLQEKAPARLMRLREKIQVLRQYPIDYCLVLRFNKALAQLSASDFMQAILIEKLHVDYLLVGDDFRFGAQRAGDFHLLQQMGHLFHFLVADITEQQHGHQRVSSTQIRELLKQGDIASATKKLGHPYFVSGRVSHGNQLGRTLGFPTANIYLHRKVVPISGIFVVKVLGLDRIYYGAANVGVRPTIDPAETRVLLEVFLLDFSGDLYEKYLTVEFLHKLRDEVRYENLELLRVQIERDVQDARLWLSKNQI